MAVAFTHTIEDRSLVRGDVIELFYQRTVIEPVLGSAVMLTVAAALFTLPSFTIRLITYTPATSGVKVGLTTVVLDSVALLSPGFEESAQL